MTYLILIASSICYSHTGHFSVNVHCDSIQLYCKTDRKIHCVHTTLQQYMKGSMMIANDLLFISATEVTFLKLQLENFHVVTFQIIGLHKTLCSYGHYQRSPCA